MARQHWGERRNLDESISLDDRIIEWVVGMALQAARIDVVSMNFFPYTTYPLCMETWEARCGRAPGGRGQSRLFSVAL